MTMRWQSGATISFKELKGIKVNGGIEIDCELEDFWKIRKAEEVKKICEAMEWPAHKPKTDG